MFRRARRETALLLLITLLPAALAGWLHPRSAFRPPAGGIAPIELATVRVWAGPVLWVDARPATAFAAAHIPGALNLTERDWEDGLGAFMAQWRPGLRVVVYCDGAQCHASQGVAQRLKRELQIEDIHVLSGGWEAWQAAQSR